MMFSDYKKFDEPEKVTVGDGGTLKAVGRGSVRMLMNLSDGVTRKCRLSNVLYVPGLTYNLVSVSKASKAASFDDSCCHFLNAEGCVIAVAKRCGSVGLSSKQRNVCYCLY